LIFDPYIPKSSLAFLQIVGIEGQNPSGHCLIASKLVDSVPLSATVAVNQHPTKKQALDLVVESTDSSYVQKEISAVCSFVFHFN
jgi:DNA polymerase alpha subunit B